MSETLSYAGTECGQRFSKLAIVSLCVGAVLIPAVSIVACDVIQGTLDCGDSVTRAEAFWWGFVGAIPGILGMLLAFVALIRVVRDSSKLRGIAMALLGLGFATFAAGQGALYMMIIAVQYS